MTAADATNQKKAMLTYDSKFSMKIFRLIMIESGQPSSELQSNLKSNRADLTQQAAGAYVSLADIMGEQWNGRRIYRLNLTKKSNKRARSVFSSLMANSDLQ